MLLVPSAYIAAWQWNVPASIREYTHYRRESFWPAQACFGQKTMLAPESFLNYSYSGPFNYMFNSRSERMWTEES